MRTRKRNEKNNEKMWRTFAANKYPNYYSDSFLADYNLCSCSFILPFSILLVNIHAVVLISYG